MGEDPDVAVLMLSGIEPLSAARKPLQRGYAGANVNFSIGDGFATVV